MAMGKAVVSTSIGAEGLGIKDGQDLILADEAPSFAEATIRILRDGAFRRQYEQAAAKLAARYDWSNIVEQFAAVLDHTRRDVRLGQP
jgi:glycosyltransferase involved in cell wall biosynthesis